MKVGLIYLGHTAGSRTGIGIDGGLINWEGIQDDKTAMNSSELPCKCK